MDRISEALLRYKWFFVTLIFAITGFMAFQASKLEIDYGVPKILSVQNQSYQEYEAFKEVFGEEKSVFLFGIDQNPYRDVGLLKKWNELALNIQRISGVDTVLSVSNNVFYLLKDTATKKLQLQTFNTQVETQAEADSIWQRISALPIYKDWIYNEKGANIMFVQIDNEVFNSPAREIVMQILEKHLQDFKELSGIEVHVSGLPHIKNVMRNMSKNDLKKFVILSFFLAFSIIFFIFRNAAAVLASLLVVSAGMIWSMGITVLLGVTVNILTGIVPTLVIVIGVPNCIYIINSFYKKLAEIGNTDLAIKQTLNEVGLATFLTNFTTAIGFFAFYCTDSEGLKEFGLLAAINVMCLFAITLLVIPFILSIYKGRKQRVRKKASMIDRFIEQLIVLARDRKPLVFSTLIVLIVFSFIGMTRLKVSGNITDDLPKNHEVFADIHWFEQEFGGVIPLEITIDAKKPRAVEHYTFLQKMQTFKDSITAHAYLSKGVSANNAVMFAKQAYYNNNPSMYAPISGSERLFLAPYLKAESTSGFMRSYVNEEKSKARISFLMKDLGLLEMEQLVQNVQKQLNTLFDPERYETVITGSSVVFLQGTRYLTYNLLQSILLAVGVISVIMAILFQSFRIILFAVITNLVPLILTAGFMGWMGINIKPSTILVFSIAFGISVDDTIHFLAKYRISAQLEGQSIALVLKTLRAVGSSMFYTSIALFLGFVIFVFSDFQGTKALGLLLSFTLVVAMFANLIVLPALLMLGKSKQ